QNDVTLKMPAFEWVHVQLHQQKGMISLSPPTICNSAHEDTRSYYDLSPASCLMHRQVGEQWVSYQHSLAHHAGPWLYDENISCPTEER
ncbi:hypothetical protein QS773_25940, partial [Escherichia coli]|nr:hypothetical protein [Escherichia coli]